MIGYWQNKRKYSYPDTHLKDLYTLAAQQHNPIFKYSIEMYSVYSSWIEYKFIHLNMC
jgi:hypothetical protein